jgi:hypothetical protein
VTAAQRQLIRRVKDESVRACLRSRQLRVIGSVRRDGVLQDPDAPPTRPPARRARTTRCGYCGEHECAEHADLDDLLDAT